VALKMEKTHSCDWLISIYRNVRVHVPENRNVNINMLHVLLISSMLATYCCCYSLLNLTILKIIDEKYKI
jgi:hypothetical protein